MGGPFKTFKDGAILAELGREFQSFGAEQENHYENTPFQIFRKFHLQKLKIFR